jgi:hypothetical protein
MIRPIEILQIDVLPKIEFSVFKSQKSGIFEEDVRFLTQELRKE